MSEILELCKKKGLRSSEQRTAIAEVLLESSDHPDTQEIHQRAQLKDASISIATVYRTMKLFKELGVVTEHNFGDGRARYEEISNAHHDHLIDINSGKIIEFQNEEIEALQKEIAKKLGFELVDHKLELYGIPLKK